MSHELTTHADGTTEFVSVVRSVEERPWHGLGQTVESAMTTKEAIELAHLNWKVRKTPKSVAETGYVIPNDFAIIREDNQKYLGGVGAGYEVVQNEDVFAFFDPIIKRKAAPIFETAGSLFDGRRIFITAKMPEPIKVLNGVGRKADDIDRYLLLTSSHDASGSIICGFTPVRVVCNNTLKFALKGGLENVVRVKHTKNVKERMAVAGKIMDLVDQSTTELRDTFNQMAKFRMTTDLTNSKLEETKILEFIACVMSNQDKIIPKEEFESKYSSKNVNLAQSILEYTLSDKTQQYESTKGSLYGTYQGITGYFQNMKSYESQEEKFDQIVIAGNSTPHKKMVKAYELAVDIMNGKVKGFLN